MDLCEFEISKVYLVSAQPELHKQSVLSKKRGGEAGIKPVLIISTRHCRIVYPRPKTKSYWITQK